MTTYPVPRLRPFLLILLVACLALPVLAQDDAEPEAEGHQYEFQSKLLARDPEIGAALAAVDADPESPEAWNALGNALANRGAYRDAIAVFQRAADLAPDEEIYISNKGAALLKAGETKKALAAFKKALRLEPFNAIAYYNLGVAHDKLGHYDKALAAYEDAFELDPALADPEQNPAVVNNENMLAIRLRVYRQTAGSTPAIYQETEE
jgi:superkiller protein 3